GARRIHTAAAGLAGGLVADRLDLLDALVVPVRVAAERVLRADAGHARVAAGRELRAGRARRVRAHRRRLAGAVHARLTRSARDARVAAGAARRGRVAGDARA